METTALTTTQEGASTLEELETVREIRFSDELSYRNDQLRRYVSFWTSARLGIVSALTTITICGGFVYGLVALCTGDAAAGLSLLAAGTAFFCANIADGRKRKRTACPTVEHGTLMGDFFRTHGETLKSLKERVRQFNLAALEYQMVSCPLREQTERYAHIIAKLAESREALVIECDEMLAYYDAALEPLRIQHEANQPPPRPVPQISEEERLRLAQAQRAQYLEQLASYLPVFEGGKAVGPNVTTDLSVHVALAVARQANDT